MWTNEKGVVVLELRPLRIGQRQFRNIVNQIFSTQPGRKFIKRFRIRDNPVQFWKEKVTLEVVVPTGYESKIKSVEVLINAAETEKDIIQIVDFLARY